MAKNYDTQITNYVISLIYDKSKRCNIETKHTYRIYNQISYSVELSLRWMVIEMISTDPLFMQYS